MKQMAVSGGTKLRCFAHSILSQKLEKELFGKIIQLETADEKDKPLSAKPTNISKVNPAKQLADKKDKKPVKKKNKMQLRYQMLKRQAKARTQLLHQSVLKKYMQFQVVYVIADSIYLNLLTQPRQRRKRKGTENELKR